MTTINQSGNILYIDNEEINATSSISINSTNICSMSATGISNTYRIPSGTSAVPISNINQIGCVIYIFKTIASYAPTSAPKNLINTGELPVGSYIILGFFSGGPTSGISSATTITKLGLFFDTSPAAVVDSATIGTPYFASANIMMSTSGTRIIGIGTGSDGPGFRIQNTMIINLTTPTIIYLNAYAESTTATLTSNYSIQITRIG